MDPKISEKAWNPELEKQILKQWEEDKIYDFTPQEDNFTIDTPPPYPSGRPWHIGSSSLFTNRYDCTYCKDGWKKCLFPYWN